MEYKKMYELNSISVQRKKNGYKKKNRISVHPKYSDTILNGPEARDK